MAEFTVPVVRISGTAPIDGADAIEVAQVLGYRCVVKKGEFAVGDLAVYIPEAAIVPDYLLDLLGLKGKLAGPQGNRVKAVRLKNTISQGLLLPLSAINVVYIDGDPHINTDELRQLVSGGKPNASVPDLKHNNG